LAVVSGWVHTSQDLDPTRVKFLDAQAEATTVQLTIGRVVIEAGDQRRLATSVGGVLTGRGADIIAIDDPLKPEEALSQGQRQAANEWFDHTLYSRLNDKPRGSIIVMMHRLHEDDRPAMCWRRRTRTLSACRRSKRTRRT